MKTKPDSMVEKVKSFIRQPYAWPGLYPLYAIAYDGEPLCKCCAKSEYPLILAATKDNDESGWHVIGVDVNWEDEQLYCAHCSKPIESAYGDTTNEVDE